MTLSTEQVKPRRTKASIKYAAEKPPRSKVLPENIPQRLKDRPCWVCWRWHWKTFKVQKSYWDKPPINPKTGKLARVNDPSTWGTFDQAMALYESGKADGIGYVPTLEAGEAVLDFDDCRDPDTGEADAVVVEQIQAINSYSEVSPTETGFRVFVEGRLPEGHRSKTGNVEVYTQTHYLTVTGNRLEGTPPTIVHRQAELDHWYAAIFGDKGNRQEKASGNGNSGTSVKDLSDDEILRRAFKSKNGDNIRGLWEGDTSGVKSGDKDNASSADQAFCNHLAFWFGKDTARMDRVFRQSKLMRDKWDEPHYADGKTYGQGTIQEAIDFTSRVYTPGEPDPVCDVAENVEAAGPGPRSNGAEAREPSSDGGNGSGDGHTPTNATSRPTVYDLVLADLRERFNPIFRIGDGIRSGTKGREVKRSELLASMPPKASLLKLAKAIDAPRGDDGVVIGRLPAAWKKWAPSAITEMINDLDDEIDADEINEGAEDDFRRQVKVACHSLKTLGVVTEKAEFQETLQLVQWASVKAEEESWKPVHSWLIWGAKHNGKLRVAIRVELFGQLNMAKMNELGKNFAKLARRYSVALPDTEERARGGQDPAGTPSEYSGKLFRLVEFTPEFLTEVLPGVPVENVCHKEIPVITAPDWS